MTVSRPAMLLFALLLSACASSPPKVPFPAFIETDELGDVFLASLPGVRAKQLAGDPMTRRTSNRIDLPADWRGTSGGAPGRSLELFVLAGVLRLADIELGPGGYAFLPSGSLGFSMRTDNGARVLYFVNDADPAAVIRSPIIIDSAILEWRPTSSPGIATKELFADPGTGATTWLVRVGVGAAVPWESSTTLREGFLVSGRYRHAECVEGEPVSGTYVTGGYFYRPPDTVNGGPMAGAETEAVWLLRETEHAVHTMPEACVPASPKN